MEMHGTALDDHAHRIRGFRINLAIFLGVNLLLLILLGALVLGGLRIGGELWPYPVVMGLWGLRVAFQGYRAYRS
jgi:hypothetical protein